MALSLQAFRERQILGEKRAQGGTIEPENEPRENAPRVSARVSQPVALLPQGLGLLLDLETRIRATESLHDLQYLLANESGILGPDCRVVVLAASRLGQLKAITASHIVKLETRAPLTMAYEKLVADRIKTHVFNQAHVLDAAHGLDPATMFIGPFPLVEQDGADPRVAVILPLSHRKKPLGALLFVSDFDWRDSATRLLPRLADTTSHAWAMHQPQRRFQIAGSARRLAGLLAVFILCLACLIPVPMTALAPMRVVTIEPSIIAAPIDGVIDEILVMPNDRIARGTPLLRYVELSLAAKAESAEREMAVAEARFKRTGMVALSSLDAKRDLAIAEAEFQLKRAERDFAVDQLRRSRVISPVDGIALFGDRRDWVGRPVAAGERILELGDASRVELQLELPVEDAIAMSIGQPVSAFLDTAPLTPVSAEVTRINHEPRIIEGRGLAFVIHAKILDGTRPPLGVRGTAHIRGELVALGLFLFRRPISSFRQWAGV
jgi:multidrug resistance efflux pump